MSENLKKKYIYIYIYYNKSVTFEFSFLGIVMLFLVSKFSFFFSTPRCGGSEDTNEGLYLLPGQWE